jgi:hypothetical protein
MSDTSGISFRHMLSETIARLITACYFAGVAGDASQCENSKELKLAQHLIDAVPDNVILEEASSSDLLPGERARLLKTLQRVRGDA